MERAPGRAGIAQIPVCRPWCARLASGSVGARVGRLAGRAQITDGLRTLLQTRPRYLWADALAAAKVPFAPVNTVDDVLADPQLAARDMIVNVPLSDGGSVRTPGNPIRLSEDARAAPSAPPRLGEHADEVLRDLLGMDPPRIAELRASGALGSVGGAGSSRCP